MLDNKGYLIKHTMEKYQVNGREAISMINRMKFNAGEFEVIVDGREYYLSDDYIGLCKMGTFGEYDKSMFTRSTFDYYNKMFNRLTPDKKWKWS